MAICNSLKSRGIFFKKSINVNEVGLNCYGCVAKANKDAFHIAVEI
jgi:hypothetical protein